MRRFTIYFILFIFSGTLCLFITNNTLLAILTGVCSSALLFLIVHILSINNRVWLALLCNTVYRKLYIRFSISYLFKIKIDDCYLLVRGNRLKDQFQPVGGVYKRFRASNALFTKYGILDDEHMPIDGISKDDLRLLVPARNVIKFIKWYNSRVDREITPEREFREELVNPGILTNKRFNNIEYKYLRTKETRIRYSTYFQCREILIADIYELELNEKQTKELKRLKRVESVNVVWLDALTIRKSGYSKHKQFRISDTSEWIL